MGMEPGWMRPVVDGMQREVAAGLSRMGGVPVTQFGSIKELVAAATGRKAMILDRDGRDEWFLGRCAVPATIAWWLATQRAELLDRPRVRIALLGAGEAEAMMNLGLIGPLCGRGRLAVEVDLVGPAAEGVLCERGLEAVRVHRAAAGVFAASANGQPADAVFALHPGFEAHAREWLIEDDGLRALASRGGGVVMASYARDEFEFDRAYAQACGFSAGRWMVNPFSFDRQHPAMDASLACGVWVLRCHGEVVDPAVRDARLAALDSAANAAAAFLEVDARAGANRRNLERAATRARLRCNDGEVREHVVLMRGFAVDLRSGVIARELAGRAKGRIATVPEDLMARVPAGNGGVVERMLWVDEVWRGILLPYLEDSGDTVSMMHALVGGTPAPTLEDLAVIAAMMGDGGEGGAVDLRELAAELNRR